MNTIEHFTEIVSIGQFLNILYVYLNIPYESN